MLLGMQVAVGFSGEHGSSKSCAHFPLQAALVTSSASGVTPKAVREYLRQWCLSCSRNGASIVGVNGPKQLRPFRRTAFQPAGSQWHPPPNEPHHQLDGYNMLRLPCAWISNFSVMLCPSRVWSHDGNWACWSNPDFASSWWDLILLQDINWPNFHLCKTS